MENYKVYMHKSPSGKIYIGITKQDVKKRWNCGNGYKTQVLFYRAIVKYGWDNIEHSILFENLTKEEAKEKEIELIQHYKQLGISYNITNGGEGTESWTDEMKEKISQSMKGNTNGLKHAIESRITVFQYSLDGCFIKEWESAYKIEQELKIPNANICKCCKGIYKQAGGYIWKHELLENVEPYKRQLAHPVKICQYSEDGTLIKIFDSASEAARFIGKTNNANIIRCCKGGTKKAYGYIWKYYNEE